MSDPDIIILGCGPAGMTAALAAHEAGASVALIERFDRVGGTEALSGGTGGALIAAGPDAGQPFALESKKDDIAFLSEFDIGLAYCIKPCWRIAGGYKVLAISGYADSQNQLPYDYSSLATNGLIQNNNSLILHGAYIGLEHTW